MNSIHAVPKMLSRKEQTDFQYILVPDNVRITSGKWLFEVKSSVSFVCGFVDGFCPLERANSLGYSSRHKWVWSMESLPYNTDGGLPCKEAPKNVRETTIVCSLDCEKGEIAFRMDDYSGWVVVATNLVTTSCFIPIVMLQKGGDIQIGLHSTGESTKTTVTPLSLLDSHKIHRDASRRASPKTDRIGMLTCDILSSVIELWPLERSLFSFLPLVVCTETSSVQAEVFSLLKKRPLLVDPFLKQLWRLHKSDPSSWLLYRDLLLLELLRELTSRSQKSTEWAERCFESMSSEWCSVSLGALTYSPDDLSVSAQCTSGLPPLRSFFP